MVDVSNGVERVRRWPRKRGPGETAKIAENQALFRNYSWAIKYLNPDMMSQIYDARKGMPLLPRDVAMMMLSGTLTYFITPSGKRIYSMAALLAVSQSLDTITQTPGMTLVRGAEQWEAQPFTPQGRPWWWAPPNPATWTKLSGNAGSLTATYDPAIGCSVDLGPISTGDVTRCLMIPIPAPTQPWVLEFKQSALMPTNNWSGCGVIIRHTASGKLKSATTRGNGTCVWDWWNGLVGNNSEPLNLTLPAATPPLFYRIVSTGSVIQWYISIDGFTYKLIFNEVLTSWFGGYPDQIGFGGNYNRSAGIQNSMNVERWVFQQ